VSHNPGLRCLNEAEPTQIALDSLYSGAHPDRFGFPVLLYSSGAPSGAFGAQRFFQKPGSRFGCATA
jgi:hypothetical protein